MKKYKNKIIIPKKTYHEFMEEIKQNIQESALVRKFVYFQIICLFFGIGLLVLFLFSVFTMKFDFLSSLLLAVVSALFLTFLSVWEFFLYRNPELKRNWMITPIWNFLDGKHLKFDIINHIIE